MTRLSVWTVRTSLLYLGAGFFLVGRDGVARVTLQSDTRSGTAKITAYSGAVGEAANSVAWPVSLALDSPASRLPWRMRTGKRCGCVTPAGKRQISPA